LQETDLLANQTDVTVKFNTGAWRHTVVAGLELSREAVTQRSYQRNGAGLLNQDVDLDNPQSVAPNLPNNLATPINRQIDTTAVYPLDTIKLNPQWMINGGIRLDHFERNDTGPVNANPNNDPNGSRQDTLFNWNVGIVYKPMPIAAFYAAYATSSNPVGQELDASIATCWQLSPCSKRRRKMPASPIPSAAPIRRRRRVLSGCVGWSSVRRARSRSAGVSMAAWW
jgi:catecholate siderophore receptor